MTPRRPTPHHPSAFCALLVGLLAAMGLLGCPDAPAPLDGAADGEVADDLPKAEDTPVEDARMDAAPEAEVLDGAVDAEAGLARVEDPSVIYRGFLGGSGAHARCRPGELAECACLDGRSGQQVCDLDGAFRACLCPVARPRVVGPPRLVSPLTHMRVSSQRPALRWVVPTETARVRVELCGDRACTRLLLREETMRLDEWRPERPLAQGMVFWRVQALDAAGGALWSSPTWLFYVGRRDAPHDTAFARPIDVNGDGYDDVLDSRSDAAMNRTFSVHFGSPAGLQATSTSLQLPESVLRGRRLGGSPLNPWSADFDGDGYTDVLVVVRSTDAGPGTPPPQAYILHGSARDPLQRFTETFMLSVLESGPDPLHLSDYNGDGFLDVMSRDGRVYVGGPSGLRALPERTGLTGLPDIVVWYLYSPGDVDGDGRSDLTGAFPQVLYGGPAFTFDLYPGSRPVADSSTIKASGDLNGDRRDDVVTYDTTPSTLGGRRSLVVDYGSSDGLVSGVGTVLYDQYPAEGYTTQRLEGGPYRPLVGDFNGDGLGDLLTMELWGLYIRFGEMSPCSQWTTLYRFDGHTTGVSLLPDVMLRSPCSRGFLISGVGDYDGDGYADIMMLVDAFAAVLRGSPEGWGTSVHPAFSCEARTCYAE